MESLVDVVKTIIEDEGREVDGYIIVNSGMFLVSEIQNIMEYIEEENLPVMGRLFHDKKNRGLDGCDIKTSPVQKVEHTVMRNVFVVHTKNSVYVLAFVV